MFMLFDHPVVPIYYMISLNAGTDNTWTTVVLLHDNIELCIWVLLHAIINCFKYATLCTEIETIDHCCWA